MGMDVSLLRVEPAADTPTEGWSVYPLEKGQIEQYRSRFGEAVLMNNTIDIWGLLEKYYPEMPLSLTSWDLEGDTPYVELSDGRMVHPTKSQIEEFSGGYIGLDLSHPTLACTEIGYMRKPFRHSFCENVRQEGDTIVLTSDNFAGVDRAAVEAILGPDALNHCMAIWGQESLDKLQQLLPFVADKTRWEEFIWQIKQDNNVFMTISW